MWYKEWKNHSGKRMDYREKKKKTYEKPYKIWDISGDQDGRNKIVRKIAANEKDRKINPGRS